jgi:catechol 2,3-dioxygenase-like lactoylglutathione lyase family enzyme
MLGSIKAFSGFSTNDIEATRAFYSEKLGIKVTEENGLLTLHLDDGSRPTLVYPKDDHEPATYTILNFPVDDIDAVVDDLAARGVTFEQYGHDEMPQDDKGVLRGKQHNMGPDIAWFKDPGGNVLSVLSE